MTAPNHAALERLSAVWHTLASNQHLPKYKRMFHVVERDQVQIYVGDAAAVDAYAEVLGLRRGGWHRSGDEWTYQAFGGDYPSRWIVALDEYVPEPLPPQSVETAENTASDRVVSHG